MEKLFIFNGAMLVVIAALLFTVKKTVKTKRAERILLIVAALVTILFHYSELIFRVITNNGAMLYLQDNRNLILPLYPCNAVMWSCLILSLLKNENSRLSKLLGDYIFWFGMVSTLVGMFANMDFIANPTLTVYGNVKSIGAHATLLFNLLLLGLFGRVKIDFFRNMKHIFIMVVAMFVIGLYCNLLIAVLVSTAEAYDENSMFILHSPFEAVPFLTYPIIASIGLVLYAALFTVFELIRYKKGERWFDKALAALKNKTAKAEEDK